jgi:hypothetical protein
MFITTSRKSNILAKRFSKYLSKYLPGIEFIPRGKTPLFKFFEKSNNRDCEKNWPPKQQYRDKKKTKIFNSPIKHEG